MERNEPRINHVSDALIGLAHHAPPLVEGTSILDTSHCVSNDDLADTFGRIRSREHTASYRQAEHRVAVLVGESALMASILHVPEETIVMVDRSPAMVAYMSQYVAALRASSHLGEWYERMGFSKTKDMRLRNVNLVMDMALAMQAERWERAGYEHPATSDQAFSEASALARQKAIIPWQADLASGRDMRKLGKVLKGYRASITLLNLTNVLVCESRFRTARQAANTLTPLPFTPDAPIVTTTEAENVPTFFPVSHPAGLFFGLTDFGRNGGITDCDSPAAGRAVRKVIRS